MTIFFSSDHHFFHSNIIKYCSRPFSDAKEMNEALIENHNKTVKPGDKVFFIGDFCFGSDPDIIHSIAKKLNGDKTIILGNHDREENFSKFPGRVVYRILELRGKNWMPYMPTLCHYPMESWNSSFHGAFQLHGHMHNKVPTDGIRRKYDVGVDANNFTPISWDEIISVLSKYPSPKEIGEKEGTVSNKDY